jgi:hypothetical protein
MSKKDEFNLRHFYVQFSMSRLKRVNDQEEFFIIKTLFDFQRRPIIGFIANEFCRE